MNPPMNPAPLQSPHSIWRFPRHNQHVWPVLKRPLKWSCVFTPPPSHCEHDTAPFPSQFLQRMLLVFLVADGGAEPESPLGPLSAEEFILTILLVPLLFVTKPTPERTPHPPQGWVPCATPWVRTALVSRAWKEAESAPTQLSCDTTAAWRPAIAKRRKHAQTHTHTQANWTHKPKRIRHRRVWECLEAGHGPISLSAEETTGQSRSESWGPVQTTCQRGRHMQFGSVPVIRYYYPLFLSSHRLPFLALLPCPRCPSPFIPSTSSVIHPLSDSLPLFVPPNSGGASPISRSIASPSTFICFYGISLSFKNK